MPLRVVAPGPLATIQDRGRSGFREFGVPVAGAFDRTSLLVANALLGNSPDDAAVELTGFGGVFRAEDEPMAVAIAGAVMTARIERSSGPDHHLRICQVVTLRPGDTLIVGAASQGHRAYLGVRHGWLTPVVMGSRSSETPLVAGDLLPATTGETPSRHVVPDRLVSRSEEPLRYLDGPDASRMETSLEDLGPYRVGLSSNRMGMRLEGEIARVREESSRLSSPVSPGAIQIAGGLPIVLGPSCGTLGGYAHVGQIISADLDRLAQIRPGESIRFLKVDLAEARRCDRERREELARLQLGLTVASRL